MLFRATAFLILVFILGPACGCGLIGPSKAATIATKTEANTRFGAKSGPSTTSPVEVQALDTGRKTDIEIIWQIPTDIADLFIIQYGFDRDKLDQRISLKPEQLEKYVDPEYGPVYRYVLQNIAQDKDIYVAMSAVSGDQTSPLSTTYQAKAAVK